MIFWALCIAAVALSTIKCEPPVNSYLPPTSGSGGRPSSQYGTPDNQDGSFGGFNPNQGRGNQPRDSYNPSGLSSSPSSEYGPPGQGSSGSQRGFRGPSGRGQGSPSSQYGTPNQQGPNRGGNGGFRGPGSSQRPDSSYGTPSQQGPGSRQFGSPSSSYGTPDFGNDLSSRNENYRGSGVDESNGPAKYEFSYMVDSPDTGTQFGHSEQRDGDVTTGEYNVLLPDGRKQVVEYEADREGFKPQIRYEGNGGRTGSGFGRGGQGQGYPSASASADAFAGSNAGYQGSGPQGGRYQQPGFGQDSSSGYPRGPSQQFGNQGQGNSGNGGYPGDNQGNGGYQSGSQGGQGGGRGNFQGQGDGYPSGGPNGLRGSGY